MEEEGMVKIRRQKTKRVAAQAAIELAGTQNREQSMVSTFQGLLLPMPSFESEGSE